MTRRSYLSALRSCKPTALLRPTSAIPATDAAKYMRTTPSRKIKAHKAIVFPKARPGASWTSGMIQTIAGSTTRPAAGIVAKALHTTCAAVTTTTIARATMATEGQATQEAFALATIILFPRSNCVHMTQQYKELL